MTQKSHQDLYSFADVLAMVDGVCGKRKLYSVIHDLGFKRKAGQGKFGFNGDQVAAIKRRLNCDSTSPASELPEKAAANTQTNIVSLRDRSAAVNTKLRASMTAARKRQTQKLLHDLSRGL